jgi:(E)-4-hydroxy-3-methylbut-2-enyl-diphosphate synthase
MSHSPLIKRKKTLPVMLGKIQVGGGAPITVQTMAKVNPHNIKAMIKQIISLQDMGCDIIRVAIPDELAAKNIKAIKNEISIPLVADIHFDHTLAIKALEAGADGLRINPGNIGGKDKIKAVVAAAIEHKAPIRVGVNSGSLEKKYGRVTHQAMVESALNNIKILENMGFDQIKVSVKASNVIQTIQAYRLLSTKCNYPLHLGVTEAGTAFAGTIHSTVAVGILLAAGIGDTIRVSLAESPELEVKTGMEILRSLNLRGGALRVIVCPTCGRTMVDVIKISHSVEDALAKLTKTNKVKKLPLVAVMGCMVNGPGEAMHADIAIAGGKGNAALFIGGKYVKTIEENKIVEAVVKAVKHFIEKNS